MNLIRTPGSNNTQEPSGGFKNNIIPLTFVLKYEPPQIGMIYKVNKNDKKRRLYKIYLHSLITKNDPIVITNQLFMEHSFYLEGAEECREQVKPFVEIFIP